jgi:predicted nucleic acid-binding protein
VSVTANAPDLPQAVLDTSVLTPRWSRLTLLALAAEPSFRYRPVWSEWTLSETWRVLTQQRLQKGARPKEVSAGANAMLLHMLPLMRLVSVANLPPAARHSPLSDPNDALVWATAVVAGAGYIVSHNTRHFPPLVEEPLIAQGRRYRLRRHLHEGIEFLTAIEFIEDVLGEDAATILNEPLPARGVIRSRRAVVQA